MKILALADVESKSLWDYYSPEKMKDVDLIISCGDLRAEYLEFLVTMTNLPVLYVPGNHDGKYVEAPPAGCINIDGKVYNHNGVRILGLGGTMRYKKGPYQFTEKEMRARVRKARKLIVNSSGIDIFVTHAPVKGYGDLEDFPHHGYACFDELLYKCHPAYMLHGHVHQTYTSKFDRETKHPSGTTIINAYDKYAFDFEDSMKNKTTKTELIKTLSGTFW